jgi:Peptidase family M1 domain
VILRFLIFILLFQVTFVSAQDQYLRAVRRNIPMTNSIQQAFDAGTRNYSGQPGANYWQIETDYDIRASIDPETQTITGSETISFHNNSPDDLRNIVLRLDHNIFRPDVPRGFSVPAEITEGMIVTKIVVNGVVVSLTQPSDGSQPKTFAVDLTKTVATINLETPIRSKSTAKIQIEWHTKLPGGEGGQGHRMTQRWDKRLFQPTQWYPRIAKYDDLRGWETSIYLGPSEFYNNFGKFDVRIEMPAGWLVSGTGQNPEEVLTKTVRERLTKVLKTDEETVIVGENERGPGKSTAEGKKLVWHYAADKVNDFAWATSNEFVWKSTRANIPEKGFVPIHMFYLPESAGKYEKAALNTRHALEFYSELLGPYPFPQLTLQDGPSTGMEYPMVINSNQGAADHETFHQWMPMMLGTNETRYGWMDEGFNNYSNILSAARRSGKKFNLDGHAQGYGRMSGDEDEAPMMWNSNFAGTSYGFQTYGKTTFMFGMLGGMVGDDELHQAIKKYVKAWAFKHPSPWDFAYFMNNEFKQDLGWFWYYWLWTTESVDGSIKSVSTNGNKTSIIIHQAGEMPSPVVLKVEFAKGGKALNSLPNMRFIDDDTAIIIFPMDVWFGGNRDFKTDLDVNRQINKITLDPAGRFPDNDPSDNIWTREAGKGGQ